PRSPAAAESAMIRTPTAAEPPPPAHRQEPRRTRNTHPAPPGPAHPDHQPAAGSPPAHPAAYPAYAPTGPATPTPSASACHTGCPRTADARSSTNPTPNDAATPHSPQPAAGSLPPTAGSAHSAG